MLLSSMQKGFFKFIFLGLLVLGAVGLMFSDYNGFFRDGGVTKTDVASVDGHQIKIVEFHDKVARTLRTKNMDAATAYRTGTIDEILQREILQIILRKTAKNFGVEISDAVVVTQVRDLISGFKTDGTTDKDALARLLQMQGLTEKQLVSLLRAESATTMIVQSVSEASYQPQVLLNDVAAFANETRSADIVFFPNESVTLESEPTNDEVKSLYASLSGAYMQPEKRDVTVAMVAQSKLIPPNPASVTDAEVQAFYDENIAKFSVAAQRIVEQVLTDSQEKADAVAKLATSGKTLKESAKEITKNDSSYYPQTGWNKDGLMPEIATPVFTAKDGDLLPPIKSPLGWHVIRVIKSESARTEPLANVQAKIRTQLQAEKNEDAAYDMTTRIEDRLANGETFESLVPEYQFKITTLKGITIGDTESKDLEFAGKNTAALLKRIFEAKEGQPTNLADNGDGMLYSVRVDKVAVASPKPFEKVSDDVRRQWIENKKFEVNIAALQKKMADIDSGKIKLASMGRKMESVNGLTRARKDAKSDASLPSEVRSRLMDADPDKVILIVSPTKKGVYLAKVTKISLSDMPADEKMRETVQKQVSGTNIDLLIKALQTSHNITINHDLLERTYGRDKNADN